MNTWLNIVLTMTNTGLTLGLTLGAMLLLRPLLTRVLSAQQRAVVWVIAWLMGYMPHLDRRAVLPVTFQDLIVPRTGGLFSPNPAFLPDRYEGAGNYSLALPGDVLLRVSLTDSLLLTLSLLWVAGMVVMVVLSVRRSRALMATARQGRKVEVNEPLMTRADITWMDENTVCNVWVSEGLPTSFVRRKLFWHDHDICLQAELTPERMELVLCHEMKHIRLGHSWWKVLATLNLVEFWWNPLVWLGFRYFCRDLELACDAAVMKDLDPDQRREYARTLVDLGTGRQLWEAPLSFGECDAALRVKAVARWKPRKWFVGLVTWGAALLVILFFYGGNRVPYPSQDLMLAWEREMGSTEGFVEVLNHEMAWKLDLATYGQKNDIPDLGITGVWEAPDVNYTFKSRFRLVDAPIFTKPDLGEKTSTVPLAALWVRTEDAWYYVWCGWWGSGTGTFGVLGLKETTPPDLSGWDRLV